MFSTIPAVQYVVVVAFLSSWLTLDLILGQEIDYREILYKRFSLPVENRAYVHYNIGVLLVSGTGMSFDLEKCAPAVDLALDYVNERYMSPHGIILDKVQSSYPTCDESLTGGKAADMKFLSNVIAFIGPSCGFALSPVARLAAYWNIPIITGLGDQPPSTETEMTGDRLLGHQIDVNNSKGVFGDKSKFVTLTRLSYCQCRLKLVFHSICNKYGWKHLAVVYDRTDLFSFTVGRTVINGMKEFGYEVYAHDVDGRRGSEMDHAIVEMRAHARSKLWAKMERQCLQESLVREFMIKVYRAGMTNGDWVFLDVELFKNKPSETNYWQTGHDESDLEAKIAYESLLTVSLLIPKSPLWTNFTDRVKAKALIDYNYTFKGDEEVNFFVGAFYDGVILLGKALNETLSANLSLTDGKAITRQMWNRGFQGMTGNVDIDENGDRHADYGILDMNPITGHFETVAYYSKKFGLRELAGAKIRWPVGRGGPAADIPPCGFLNNHPSCKPPESVGIFPYVASIGIIFLLVGTCIVMYIYRHMRQVEAATSTRWRIWSDELLFDNDKSRPVDQESSCGSVSIGGGTGSRIGTFAPVAMYRGTQLAVRKLVLMKRVEFTKQIIAEIRQAKDVQHENISRLVGLCLGSSDTARCNSEKWDQILVLTEYCSRGSLRDVLLNGHIHLDWPFRLSLISDMVNGMMYLHSCQLTHGNLSSMKCLVDARFVVKINDFGLNMLYSVQKQEKDQDYFAKKFWTAPELLSRSSHRHFSCKGDVYSFGIILSEVKIRALPYTSFVCSTINPLTPEEIINRVESNRIPPFRPLHGDDDYACPGISSLITQCWAESPEDRPDFGGIKQSLKKFLKGAGTMNLVDDLLRRLEQHATHLETLVDDKTRELAQEKRRSEDLLFQLLPRQVADQLLRGEPVVPESFDAVTIYFSDVVGFTSLCTKSTPIQVVDFLNQLYGCFDGILDAYDAYKIETIGDAYLVVSGCPTRNGDKHVTEIACLAFSILEAVQNFVITHLPEEQLKIRIGIHTGPVCAGCVGHRMPHYCLIGDTVNTASRMESTGLPLKIHISEATATALSQVGGYHIVRRGEVILKGKGTTVTYWLEGCDDDSLWKRVPPGKSSSRESLDTKVFTGSPSTSGFGGLFSGMTPVSSVVSASQHLNFSPSNHTTTICITPADDHK